MGSTVRSVGSALGGHGSGSSIAGTMMGGSVLGGLYGQGGVLGMLHGTGSNSGVLGMGQYHSDAFNADPTAFAPDANESAFIKALQGQAYGTAPSAAQLQMQQGISQATNQAQAMAASQRGINPALAARLAAQSQASLAQQGNAQTGILRAQEQQQGLGALGGELRSVREGRENYQGLQSSNYNDNNRINSQAYSDAGGRRSGLLTGIGTSLFSGAMSKGGVVPGVRMMADGGMASPDFLGQAISSQEADARGRLEIANNSSLNKGGQSMGGGLKNLMASGGNVPGKAQVSGDSLKNDTVPTLLSPGEAVIPRSVMQAKHPGDAAKAFIEQLKNTKTRKKGEAPSFAELIAHHREMGEMLKKCAGGKV